MNEYCEYGAKQGDNPIEWLLPPGTGTLQNFLKKVSLGKFFPTEKFTKKFPGKQLFQGFRKEDKEEFLTVYWDRK